MNEPVQHTVADDLVVSGPVEDDGALRVAGPAGHAARADSVQAADEGLVLTQGL